MSLLRLSLFGLLLLPVGARAEAVVPQRIVSLNLCTDQLLLALVEPDRIASITWLSRSEGDPAQRDVARRIAVNHGSAEEVLAAHPDLVLAGRYTTATTRRLLRGAGITLLEVDAVTDWEGIRRITRQVAAATGTVSRGEVLLQEMDVILKEAAAVRPARPVRAIGWSGAGEDVPGADTLFNTILTTAGALNIAAQERGTGSFDLEQVARARPEVLLRGSAYADARSLRGAVAVHPVLRDVPHAVVEYPEGVYGCGVPRAAQLALGLAHRLAVLAVAGQAR